VAALVLLSAPRTGHVLIGDGPLEPWWAKPAPALHCAPGHSASPGDLVVAETLSYEDLHFLDVRPGVRHGTNIRSSPEEKQGTVRPLDWPCQGAVVQLVRTSVSKTEGPGFESWLPRLREPYGD
jgi:hypothetical protein